MQMAIESLYNSLKVVRNNSLKVVRTGSAAAWKAIARFRDERNGNAAILFGLSLVPLVFLGGMGLDFSSAIQKRTLLNAAADAAALAAVTPAMLQQSAANAQAAAENLFNAETSAIQALSSTA